MTYRFKLHNAKWHIKKYTIKNKNKINDNITEEGIENEQYRI